MGFLENIRASASESRAIGGLPWRPWDSPLFRFDVGGPAHPSRMATGVDAALGLPALYAGAKLLSDGTASLPLNIYQNYRDPDGYSKHRLYEGPTIFDEPSMLGTQFDWLFSCMSSLILHGNAWGFITGRDAYGYPLGIEWIPPQDVMVIEAAETQNWNPLAAKVYVFGREVKWRGPDAEVFHVKAFSLPGRLEGISVLKAFALTITAGHQAQQYGTSFYDNGGFPIGVFQNSEIEIDATQAKEIRHSLVDSLRKRQPLVYGRDWDYKPVTCPPNEAQFIEAMQLTATQIAAILALPAGRLGGTDGNLTYTNQEQSSLQIIESLRPWLVRLEQAFFKLLPQKRFTKFNTDALLKTDLETRMNIYQIQRNIGLRTADEIRSLEDLPPLPNGVGAEALPLTLMVSLGARAGVIPKSIMKSVILEMDVATDRLKKLESTYVNVITQGTPSGPNPPNGQGGGAPKPGGAGQGSPSQPQQAQAGTGSTSQRVALGMPMATPPFTQDPASYLASLITMQRDMSLPEETRRDAEQAVIRIMERADQIARDGGEDGPGEAPILAPWMPSKRVKEIMSNHIDLDKRPEVEE